MPEKLFYDSFKIRVLGLCVHFNYLQDGKGRAGYFKVCCSVAGCAQTVVYLCSLCLSHCHGDTHSSSNKTLHNFADRKKWK